MMQYFTEILKTFSIAQRIWALIILCISVFFITFGSNIIDAIKPDPIQENLVVKRQKSQIISLNTQLDSLTLRVDDLELGEIDSYDREQKWGLSNFVHTPRENEGIKQAGVKDKLLQYLND